MAKKFSDLMAGAGFATRRADQPFRVRVIERDGLGEGTSSGSPGSDRGASARFHDDAGVHQAGAVEPETNNRIEATPDDTPPQYTNPYTGLPTKARPFTDVSRPTPKDTILENVLQGTDKHLR
jgi:hypothetical protein